MNILVATQENYNEILHETSEATEMAARCACVCYCANCGTCGCSCICQPGKCNCPRFIPDMEEMNSNEVLNDFFEF